MSLRFTPKSEKEIEEERLIPEGTYGFEVTQAVQTESKSGNDMIKVMMKVFKPDGNFVFVTDYIVLTDNMMYKLLHFCQATGLEEAYESGEFALDDAGALADFTGATGELKLGIQKSDDYPDRNTVKDYIKAEASKAKKKTKLQLSKEAQKPLDDDLEDEIPF